MLSIFKHPFKKLLVYDNYATIFPNFYKGILLFNLQNYSTQNIKNDILSGTVVAVALVPEAIAFSFIAGVSPVVGLYAAFIIGLVTSILGGKPGMISGATGLLRLSLSHLVLVWLSCILIWTKRLSL